ncbi:MAG TPA: hypothetical protein VFP40_10180 [Terriglobales bacterium]|nr:hypothetical protein [Terriglobales bacterium]
MNANSDVSRCANPECKSKFVRFGDGELFVFPLTDPQAWDLPKHVKQKVYWLCDHCCSKFYVRLDRRHKAAQVVHRPESTRRVA